MAYTNRLEIDAKFPPKTVFGYIYIWTNKINGKQYVGQTINLDQREYAHIYYDIAVIDKAISKYGEKNFDRSIIDVAFSKEELDEKEVQWISFYDTFKNGYNQNLGGKGGCSGEDSHKFSGDYFQVNTIFGDFVGCFAGLNGTASELTNLSGTTIRGNTISDRKRSNNFHKPVHKYLLTPITKEQYHDFLAINEAPIQEKTVDMVHNTEEVAKMSVASSYTVTEETQIEVEEFKNKLTDRQVKVLSLLEQGFVQDEVAEKLGISQATVWRTINQLKQLYNEYVAS